MPDAFPDIPDPAEWASKAVTCPDCGQPVTLTETPWPAAGSHEGTPAPPDHPLMLTGSWVCPWCQKRQASGFPGKLAQARKAP